MLLKSAIKRPPKRHLATLEKVSRIDYTRLTIDKCLHLNIETFYTRPYANF